MLRRPPFLARPQPSILAPREAARSNNPPATRAPRPSTQAHPAVRTRCPSHRTYLELVQSHRVPVQSHPHSTVHLHASGKPPAGQLSFRTVKFRFAFSRFPAGSELSPEKVASWPERTVAFGP